MPQFSEGSWRQAHVTKCQTLCATSILFMAALYAASLFICAISLNVLNVLNCVIFLVHGNS